MHVGRDFPHSRARSGGPWLNKRGKQDGLLVVFLVKSGILTGIMEKIHAGIGQVDLKVVEKILKALLHMHHINVQHGGD